MTVKIGDRAIYRPRVPYGRQSELFAFVTRVVDADRGVVDLIAFPANSELMHVSNVAPMGGLVQIHCWEPSAEDKRIEILEHRIAFAEKLLGCQQFTVTDKPSEQWTPEQIAQMAANKAQKELQQAQAVHEGVGKRGPGRPRKVDAA